MSISNDFLAGLREGLEQLIKDAGRDAGTRKLLRDLVQAGQPDRTGKTGSAEKKVAKPRKTGKRGQPVSVVLDPFAGLEQQGETALQQRLLELEIRDLIDIIKYYGFDPTRKSYRWRKKERLAGFIIERIQAKAKQGDVFAG